MKTGRMAIANATHPHTSSPKTLLVESKSEQIFSVARACTKKLLVFVALAVSILVPHANLIAKDSTLWGWDTSGIGGMFRIDDAAMPTTWNYVRSEVFLAPAMDLDQNTGELFAVDDYTFTIGTVDTNRGMYTSVASITGDIIDAGAASIRGVAYDPTDGAMYCADGGKIYTIDVATGVTSSVGPLTGVGFGIDNILASIDIDNAGQMYGFEYHVDGTGDNGRLWQIDKTSGAMTLLGTSGVDNVNFTQGMDFDPDTNILHATIVTLVGEAVSGDYGIWDLSTPGTAAFTTLAPLSDGFAGMELVFAIVNGTVFGQDASGSYGRFDIGDLSSWIKLRLEVQSLLAFEGYGSNFYGIDSDSAFGRVNKAVGIFVPMFPLSGHFINHGNQTPTGLTHDRSADKWYVVERSHLFELDIVTGNCVSVGEFEDGTVAVAGSVFEGRMFVFDSESDNLLEVSLNDASTIAIIGNVGFDAGAFIQGMDHDPNGLLYQASVGEDAKTFKTTGRFGTWDLMSGVFTEITQTDMLPDPDADGVSPKITFPGYIVELIDIYASSLEVTTGVVGYGSGLNELQQRDNIDLILFRNPSLVGSRTELVVKAQSTVANPVEFEFTLEGSVFGRRDVTQTIALWNYDENIYEVLSTEIAERFSDRSVTVTATGNLSRFVGPENEIRTRIRYEGSIGRLNFASNTDYLFWFIR